MISTVPTAAAAAGHLHRGDRRAGAGDLRSGDDAPAPTPARRLPATRFRSAGWIRWRWRCCSAIRCRRRPGTANNYRRTGRRGRRPGSVRRPHRPPVPRRTATRLFGRLIALPRRASLPVTPLPDGSGVTTGTLGPQDTTAVVVRVELSAHVLDATCSTSCASATRAARSARTAAQLSATAGAALSFPGIPSTARFPNTLPTFLISGYQQLGSPANTASDFSTSVTEVADSLTWLKGRHTIKFGSRLALGAAERRAAAVADRARSPSTPSAPTCPASPNTGTPLASFLLGQVQHVLDRSAAGADPGTRALPGVLRPGRLEGLRSADDQPRAALHAEFPVHRDQRPDGGLQPADAAARVSGRRNPVARRSRRTTSVRASAPSTASTDRTVVSAGYGLVWIEMAGITTPFTTPAFPFLQTVSQRTLDNIIAGVRAADGPSVAPIAPTPTAGLGQGVFAVDAHARLRLRAAVERLAAAGARRPTRRSKPPTSARTSPTSASPTRNLNQLTVEPARARRRRCYSACPIRTSASSRGRRRSATRRFRWRSCSSRIPQYTTVSLYRNNVGTTRYQGARGRAPTAPVAAACRISVAYTRSKLLRRCLVGVRRVDPDRPGRQLSGRRQLQPLARARLLDRRHPARASSSSARVGSARSAPAGARRLRGVLGALANDWTVTALVTLQSGVPVAVTQATNFNAFAGFGTQRPNLVGDPDAAGRPAHAEPLVRHRGLRDRAGRSRSARPRAIRSAGRRIATSISR